MFWFSGFNGFKQIDALLECISSKGEDYSPFNYSSFIKSLISFKFDYPFGNFLFQWSFCLVYQGSFLWLCGFADGSENSIKKIESPKNLSVTQVSCNRRHMICITEGGGCWQYNFKSGLWKDLAAILSTEQDKNSTSKVGFTKVCCGEMITIVLTDNGEVYTVPNKLKLPGKVIDIACGRAHSLMLTDRGDVFVVGEGSRGQLGTGELENEEEPRLVQGLAGLKVCSVACGGWHSCAVTSDGDLYSWGWNMAGQLGLHSEDGSSQASVQAVPQVVDWPDADDVSVIKVACGARHTIALLGDGSVWGCGWNEYGQLALAGVKKVNRMSKLPVPVQPVRDINCGDWSSSLIT